MKESRSEFIDISGLRYHVRRWGDPAAPMLMFLHGYMDNASTFQFVVEALQRDWNIVAPDWRGFGQSEWVNETYWLTDFLTDLDALTDHYSPEVPLHLVAHSMGGNIASLFAGIRPARVAGLVNMEGVGISPRGYDQDPGSRFRDWLDACKQRPEQRMYDDPERYAAMLRRLNPRLTREQASFLAPHALREGPPGLFQVAADPAHRARRPVSIPLDDFVALWQNTTAPVLFLGGEDSDVMEAFTQNGEDTLESRLANIANFRKVMVADAGHNMQHDQPEQIATLIEQFYRQAHDEA